MKKISLYFISFSMIMLLVSCTKERVVYVNENDNRGTGSTTTEDPQSSDNYDHTDYSDMLIGNWYCTTSSGTNIEIIFDHRGSRGKIYYSEDYDQEYGVIATGEYIYDNHIYITQHNGKQHIQTKYTDVWVDWYGSNSYNGFVNGQNNKWRNLVILQCTNNILKLKMDYDGDGRTLTFTR